MSETKYTLARIASRRPGKDHLIRPDRKRMVLCKAERNPYCTVEPLDWGRLTVDEWRKLHHVHLCEVCVDRAARLLQSQGRDG